MAANNKRRSNVASYIYYLISNNKKKIYTKNILAASLFCEKLQIKPLVCKISINRSYSFDNRMFEDRVLSPIAFPTKLNEGASKDKNSFLTQSQMNFHPMDKKVIKRLSKEAKEITSSIYRKHGVKPTSSPGHRDQRLSAPSISSADNNRKSKLQLSELRKIQTLAVIKGENCTHAWHWPSYWTRPNFTVVNYDTHCEFTKQRSSICSKHFNTAIAQFEDNIFEFQNNFFKWTFRCIFTVYMELNDPFSIKGTIVYIFFDLNP